MSESRPRPHLAPLTTASCTFLFFLFSLVIHDVVKLVCHERYRLVQRLCVIVLITYSTNSTSFVCNTNVIPCRNSHTYYEPHSP